MLQRAGWVYDGVVGHRYMETIKLATLGEEGLSSDAGILSTNGYYSSTCWVVPCCDRYLYSSKHLVMASRGVCFLYDFDSFAL